MSQFLKLSFILINKKYIKTILPNIPKQKYTIIFTSQTEITIRKDSHPEDYKIVDDWIIIL